jgi:hypothetical protein
MTALGLFSSQLILQENGLEDAQRSRRVEFVVVTYADKRLSTILEEIRKDWAREITRLQKFRIL